MPAAQAAPPPSWRRHADLSGELLPTEAAPKLGGSGVCLEILPDPIALLRLGSGMPECVINAAQSGLFCVVVQEPSAATAWVPRRLLPEATDLVRHDGAKEQTPGTNWCALRIGRSASSSSSASGASRMTADCGTAATICGQIAAVASGARLLSPFGMEVVMVPEANLSNAAAVLVSYGHAVWPSERVCNLKPLKFMGSAPSEDDAAVDRRLVGVWNLVHREEPPGTIVQEYADGEGAGAVRVQVPSGFFIEVRVPQDRSSAEHLSEQASFGGRCRAIAGKSAKHATCFQSRSIDFQPPFVEVPRFELVISDASIEWELVRGSQGAGGIEHQPYRELWARIGNHEVDGRGFAALELDSESPTPATKRSGLWLFCGRRFAYLVGAPRGVGLVAGTCCKSLGQLQRLRGVTEVRSEVRDAYEVVYGTVEELGHFRATRSWQSSTARSGETFYRAGDKKYGKVKVGKEFIVRVTPGGRQEKWRIVEWTFNPFASAPIAEKASKVPAGGRVEKDGGASCDEESAAPTPEGEASEAAEDLNRVAKAKDSVVTPAVQETRRARVDAGECSDSSGFSPVVDDVDFVGCLRSLSLSPIALPERGTAFSSVRGVAPSSPDRRLSAPGAADEEEDPDRTADRCGEEEAEEAQDDVGASGQRLKKKKKKEKVDVETKNLKKDKGNKVGRACRHSTSPSTLREKKRKREKVSKEKGRKAHARDKSPDTLRADDVADEHRLPMEKKKKNKKDKDKKAKKDKSTKALSEEDEDSLPADDTSEEKIVARIRRERRSKSPPLVKLREAKPQKHASQAKRTNSDPDSASEKLVPRGGRGLASPKRKMSPPRRAKPPRQALSLAAKALQDVRAGEGRRKAKASLKAAVAVAASPLPESPPRKSKRSRSRDTKKSPSPRGRTGRDSARDRERSVSKGGRSGRPKQNGRNRSRSRSNNRRKRSPSGARRGGSRNALKAIDRSRSPPVRKGTSDRNGRRKGRD